MAKNTNKNANKHKAKNKPPLVAAPAGAMDFGSWLKAEKGIGKGQKHDLNPQRKNRLRTAYNTYASGFSATPPPPGGPAPAPSNPFTPAQPPGGGFSGTNDYEGQYSRDNPEQFARGFFQTAGLSPGGQDAFGQWMERTAIPESIEDWKAMLAESDNQNLSYLDYLGNMGPAKYGTPGWNTAFNQYVYQRYLNAPLEAKGLSYAPYEGPSRTIFYG